MESKIQIILFILLVLLPITMSLICLYYSFWYLKGSWILKDTPLSKIRSASQGYVELSGLAKPIPNLEIQSKLGKMPCVWYRYSVAILRRTQTESGTQEFWEVCDEGSSITPFFINDGTGDCLVYPDLAEIIPSHKALWYGKFQNPNDVPEQGFWSQFFDQFVQTDRYQYLELRIDKNDPITATGVFTTINKDNPLLQEDLYKNSAEDLQKLMLQQGMDVINLLTKQGLPAKHQYMISSLQEAIVAKKYRINALMYFLGFLFFSAASATSIYSIASKSHLETLFKFLSH